MVLEVSQGRDSSQVSSVTLMGTEPRFSLFWFYGRGTNPSEQARSVCEEEQQDWEGFLQVLMSGRLFLECPRAVCAALPLLSLFIPNPGRAGTLFSRCSASPRGSPALDTAATKSR